MEWIDVKDRLPQSHVQIIVDNGGEVRCGIYHAGNFYALESWELSQGVELSKVKAWMPLPKKSNINQVIRKT